MGKEILLPGSNSTRIRPPLVQPPHLWRATGLIQPMVSNPMVYHIPLQGGLMQPNFGQMQPNFGLMQPNYGLKPNLQ